MLANMRLQACNHMVVDGAFRTTFRTNQMMVRLRCDIFKHLAIRSQIKFAYKSGAVQPVERPVHRCSIKRGLLVLHGAINVVGRQMPTLALHRIKNDAALPRDAKALRAEALHVLAMLHHVLLAISCNKKCTSIFWRVNCSRCSTCAHLLLKGTQLGDYAQFICVIPLFSVRKIDLLWKCSYNAYIGLLRHASRDLYEIYR